MMILTTGKDGGRSEIEVKSRSERQIGITIHVPGLKPSWATLDADELAALIGVLNHHLRSLERRS